MLAAIKMEVMTPSKDCPDEGSIGSYHQWLTYFSFLFGSLFTLLLHDINSCCLFSAIEFYMPPICSPLVRPGRPAEEAPVISKQLSDTILRHAYAVTV